MRYVSHVVVHVNAKPQEHEWKQLPFKGGPLDTLFTCNCGQHTTRSSYMLWCWLTYQERACPAHHDTQRALIGSLRLGAKGKQSPLFMCMSVCACACCTICYTSDMHARFSLSLLGCMLAWIIVCLLTWNNRTILTKCIVRLWHLVETHVQRKRNIENGF